MTAKIGQRTGLGDDMSEEEMANVLFREAATLPRHPWDKSELMQMELHALPGDMVLGVLAHGNGRKDYPDGYSARLFEELDCGIDPLGEPD